MTEKSSKCYRLMIYRDSSVRTVILDGSRWLIGRADDCDIILADTSVSRQHLVIERQGDGFHFKDLGGTNPTLLNGRPIRSGELHIGGTLLVGLTRLTLDTLDSPADIEIIRDPMKTSTIFRHYLDEGAVPLEADHSQGHTRAIANFLERLTIACADFETEEEVAKSYLDALLSHTRHRTGIIARFHGDALAALASVSGAGETHVGVPSNLVQEMLTRPRAIYLRDDKDFSNSTILVPMGKGPGGLILMVNPAENAPPGPDCLHLANTLAPIIWSRILETRVKAKLRKEVESLRCPSREANSVVLGSSRLLPIRNRLLELAPQKSPLRLLGEQGTEAEELAQFLHTASPRAGKPFRSFHIAGLSPSQAEIELIGDPDPGLQPATHMRCALMETEGGTLYIDQPSLLPTHLQDQIALTIQTGLLERPGQGKIAIDVRFVVGCREVQGVNSDSGMVSRLLSQFGPPIIIPPLRSSTEDIFALAEQFLESMGSGPDGAPRTFTDSAKMALVGYHWPGNVRELRQVIETAAARAGRRPIAPRHLPKLVTQPDPDPRQPNLSTLRDVEKRYITTVLEATQGNRAMAARVLGVATSTLYHKMTRYKMDTSSEAKNPS